MAELLQDGTKRITISQAQYQEISRAFQKFYRQTKCGVIMLSDASGLALVQSGKLDSQKMILLSTVAAGNYAATREMAKLIGEEDGFKVQFHEGDGNNIYVCGIDESFFLVIVFDQSTTFGMIRVLAARTIAELAGVLSAISTEVEHQAAPPELAGEDFREELSSRLAAVLSTK